MRVNFPVSTNRPFTIMGFSWKVVLAGSLATVTVLQLLQIPLSWLVKVPLGILILIVVGFFSFWRYPAGEAGESALSWMFRGFLYWSSKKTWMYSSQPPMIVQPKQKKAGGFFGFGREEKTSI